MSDQRIRCLTPGCENTIQRSTAKKTGGYCGPCDGKKKQTARDQYIQANRKEVDLYAGITDPVEILRIMHQHRMPDPLIKLVPAPKTVEELYAGLTEVQAQRVIAIAIDSLRGGADAEPDEIARALAAFTDFDLTDLLTAIMARGRIWPAIAFHRASALIRDYLFNLLDVVRYSADKPLQALAWIGDDAVVEAFQAFDASPPAWASALHIKPLDYTRVAGWEIVGGRRRELRFNTCVAIRQAPNSPMDSLMLASPKNASCPWCKRPLVSLLDIDLSDPLFSFLEMSGRVVDVTTCEVCTCFGDVYGRLDSEGRGHWAEDNDWPKRAPDDSSDWGRIPWFGVPIELARRRPMQAADYFLPTTFSQVGGFPAWVQDMAYPRCRGCGQTMKFLAQLDQSQFRAYEGVYYAFICQDCRTTATGYQQT